MHVVILVLVAFWAAQPATKDHPVVPESVHTATAVTFSQEACEALGQATVSQVTQSKGVANAGYVCVAVDNDKDTQA